MSHSDPHRQDAPADLGKGWFYETKNINRIVYGLYGFCALLLVIDPFVYKHGFDIAHWFGFYGFYGFLGCVGLVLAAKEMRRVVMRSEDYYDR